MTDAMSGYFIYHVVVWKKQVTGNLLQNSGRGKGGGFLLDVAEKEKKRPDAEESRLKTG